jgi:hypothetical protein
VADFRHTSEKESGSNRVEKKHMSSEDSLFPSACVFCGQTLADINGSQIMIAVDRHGHKHTSALCGDCVLQFLLTMAHEKREEFERFVEEARSWKPGDP